jgi:hypothetical protein
MHAPEIGNWITRNSEKGVFGAAADRFPQTRLGPDTSLGTAYRQPMTRRLVRLHRDERSAIQIGFETREDILNQFDYLGGTQSLHSHTDYGRSIRPGDCQDRMKVRVQGHYDGMSLQRESENLLIAGFRHPDFTDM